MSILTAATADAIRGRRPFLVGSLMGYTTHGGTYMLATPAPWTDDGYRRDLVAILPGDLGHGRVLPLYVGVNPALVDEVERLLLVDDLKQALAGESS